MRSVRLTRWADAPGRDSSHPRHAGEVRRSAYGAYSGGRSDLRAALGVLLARVCRTARYAGNISETSWSRRTPAHDIRLCLRPSLVALSTPLHDGRGTLCQHYGERTSHMTRTPISYLDRYNGAIAETRYRYAYDGNRISRVRVRLRRGQTPVTEYAYRYIRWAMLHLMGPKPCKCRIIIVTCRSERERRYGWAAQAANTYVVGVAPHVCKTSTSPTARKVRATDERGRATNT